MPLYYFDLLDGDTLVRDEEGQDLPDVEAARCECIESARELIASGVRKGIDVTHRLSFRVRDESDDIVVEVPFRTTLKPS